MRTKKRIKRSAATPGGVPSNAAKRQKIDRLDSLHKAEGHRSPGNAGPPKASEKIRHRRGGDVYDSLSKELKSGPHCIALNLPTLRQSRGQTVQDIMSELAKTDPSHYPDRISVETKAACQAHFRLSNDRKKLPPAGNGSAARGGVMSNSARKKKGLDPLQSQFMLEEVEALHDVWEASAAEMAENMADSLVSQRLDYHGCRLKVVQCRNLQLVGREGVVVKDSTTTAHLAGHPPNMDKVEDPDMAKIYHVPKAGTTFTFLLPGRRVDPRQITILGSNLGRQPKK